MATECSEAANKMDGLSISDMTEQNPKASTSWADVEEDSPLPEPTRDYVCILSGLLQGHNREDCDIMLSHFKLAYRMLDFNRNAGEIIIELKDKESFERAKGVNGQFFDKATLKVKLLNGAESTAAIKTFTQAPAQQYGQGGRRGGGGGRQGGYGDRRNDRRQQSGGGQRNFNRDNRSRDFNGDRGGFRNDNRDRGFDRQDQRGRQGQGQRQGQQQFRQFGDRDRQRDDGDRNGYQNRDRRGDQSRDFTDFNTDIPKNSIADGRKKLVLSKPSKHKNGDPIAAVAPTSGKPNPFGSAKPREIVIAARKKDEPEEPKKPKNDDRPFQKAGAASKRRSKKPLVEKPHDLRPQQPEKKAEKPVANTANTFDALTADD